jgi:mono/diheme cytochrome c family protein
MQLLRLLASLIVLFSFSAPVLGDSSGGEAEHHHHDTVEEADHHHEHDAAAAETRGAGSQLLTGARMLAAQRGYETYCAGCHGSLKDEDPLPAAALPLAGSDRLVNMTGAQLQESLDESHDAGIKEGWQSALGRDDVAALLDYLRGSAPPPSDDLAERAQQIYGRTCSVCHGEKGNAASWARDSLNPSPFDFTSEKARKLTRQRMIHSVTYGVDGTAMMPFTTQLTREEIAATVDYIRATFMASLITEDHGEGGHAMATNHGSGDDHHANHGEGIDPAAPLPDGLLGDALAGEKLYKTNCVDCHGAKGDGQGRRAYFMRIKPRDLTSEKTKAEFNRPHLFVAISKGVLKTEMPAWDKVLTPQEIADLAEYVHRVLVQREGLRAGAQAEGETPGPAWEKGDTKKN